MGSFCCGDEDLPKKKNQIKPSIQEMEDQSKKSKKAEGNNIK